MSFQSCFCYLAVLSKLQVQTLKNVFTKLPCKMLDFCLHLKKRRAKKNGHQRGACKYLHACHGPSGSVCPGRAGRRRCAARRTAPHMCAAQPRTCAPFHVSRLAWMARQGLQGIYACMVDDAVNFYEKCESFFRIPICTETLKKWLLGFQNIILFLFSMNPQNAWNAELEMASLDGI